MQEHIHISAVSFLTFLLYFVIATVLIRTLSAYVHTRSSGAFANALAYVA